MVGKSKKIPLIVHRAPNAPSTRHNPRAKRPGQQVNRRQRNREQDSDNDSDAYDGDSSHPPNSRRGINYEERQRRADQAKQERLFPAIRSYVASIPHQARWQAELQQIEMEHIRQRVEEVTQLHPCCRNLGHTDCLHLTASVNIVYISFSFITPLEINQFRCSECDQVVAVEPEQVGCSPQSFAAPTVWFNNLYLEQTKRLALDGGVSTDGEVHLAFLMDTYLQFNMPDPISLFLQQWPRFIPVLIDFLIRKHLHL